MKLVRNIAFGAVMILYLWFPFSMIADQQRILKEGEVFRFRPQPVDPYDAFRGRHIILSFVEQDIDFPNAQDVFQYDDKIYVQLERDSLGFTYFTNPAFKKPESQNYLKVTVWNASEKRVAVFTPENLERYYLNEKLAPKAEEQFLELVRSAEGDEVNVYLDARVLNGEVLIEELYFEGKPVSEYLNNL
jgi:uncharacterized membrane-anchored protein